MWTFCADSEDRSYGRTIRLSLTANLACLLLFLAMLHPSFDAYAEETKVYTDGDLAGYAGMPTGVDAETLARKEADLREWEKERAAEALEEQRRLARRAQRQINAPGRTGYQSSGGGPVFTGGAGEAAATAGAANAARMTGAAQAAGAAGPSARPT